MRYDINANSKICTRCTQEQSLIAFGNYARGGLGKKAVCKPCEKIIHAAYRKTPGGKERYSAYQKKFQAKAENKVKHRAFRNTPLARWKLCRANAKKRGLVFTLLLEDFTLRFWQQPCVYCGDKLAYAGVDRVDNTQGYTPANTVACCATCNFMKLKTGYVAFVAKCQQIALYSAQHPIQTRTLANGSDIHEMS